MSTKASGKMCLRLGTLALSLVPSLFAQSDRGSIVGTVADPSGAAIPGAIIRATQTTTNFLREVISTETGRFAVSELPPALYNLTITKDGFSTFTQTGITVGVSQVSTVDITM